MKRPQRPQVETRVRPLAQYDLYQEGTGRDSAPFTLYSTANGMQFHLTPMCSFETCPPPRLLLAKQEFY